MSETTNFFDAEPDKRYRFVKDDDGHLYAIPADKQAEFTAWMKAQYDEPYNVADDDGEDYEKYRLGSHPSRYTFENIQID